jgi:hypothetical protein
MIFNLIKKFYSFSFSCKALNVDPHSVKSLTVKLITKKVDEFEMVLVVNKEKLNNSRNVNNLSETFEVSDDESNEFGKAKSSLLIKQVYSMQPSP